MAKYINSYGVSVNFTPWFDTGFTFTKLHLYEELGGKIPGGEIDMDCDGSGKALKLVTDQITGTLTLEKERGSIYIIDIFVTNKRYYKNTLTLSFICIKNKKFFTELVTTEWDDITKALKSLYPGKIDLRVPSDINNGIKIYQNRETNYSLCTKLAYSYRHKTIFGFGWEGFFIKETIGKFDSGGHIEPFWTIAGNVDIHQIDSYNMNYNKRLYHNPLNPWSDEDIDYSDKMAKNNKTIKIYNKYLIVGTDYYQLIDNYWFNKKFMDSDLFTSFRVVEMNFPKYKLGDVLKYDRDEQDEVKLPFELFLVRSNELFISVEGYNSADQNGLTFSWTSKFIGLEEKGSVLPDTDPTN